MANTKAAQEDIVGQPPIFSFNPAFIALRYLTRKKLSYLAILGVMLSVGTIIVVTSVFTGFYLQLVSIIRGYLTDITVRPASGKLYGLENWQSWAEVLKVEHVVGVAPFVEGIGLLRLPGTEQMSPVFFRGVDPDLEGTVSELPKYMIVGSLAGLRETYRNPEGGPLRACLVGKEFPGFTEELLRRGPGQLILVTATGDLQRRLSKFAVNGMFRTGHIEYDSQFVIMGLDAATAFVDSKGAVSGLSVKLDDYKHVDQVRSELQRRLRPGTELRHLRGEAPLSRVVMAADGRRLAGLAQNGRLYVWDTWTGQILLELSAEADAALALDSRGHRLVTGHADGSVLVRSVDEGTALLEAHVNGPVTALRFSPDDFLLAVGTGAGRLAVLDADTGTAVSETHAHNGAVTCVAFAASSEQVLTTGQDGCARLWPADRLGGPLMETERGGQPVLCGAVSSDGDLVVTIQQGGRAVLWSARMGAQVLAWQVDERPCSVVFGRRSGEIVTAGSDGVRLWSAVPAAGRLTMQPYLALGGGGVRSAAFQADGGSVAAVGPDGGARLLYSGPPMSVRTWQDERRHFLEAVGMERFLMVLIMSLILVVAEFFLFALVTTMVYEKRRDIGILKAIGFTHGQICQVFLLCGLAIGVLGGLLGVGGGLLFAHHINEIREFVRQVIHYDPFPPDIYYFDKIPVHVGFWTPVVTAGVAIVCSLLFSIVPALRAARMDPVETLHYE